MSIFVIGINHKTAPVALREKVYFAKDLLPIYLQDLLNSGLAQEAVLLSTCNRSELYCEAADINAICDWFCAQTTLARECLQSALYLLQDEEALSHMMHVAAGLDSMILGEPQILGQMKEAFSESCAVSAVNTLFHRVFQQIFTVAKEIRTTTAIGACPVSVASSAVHFARSQYSDFSSANVILLGAGETSLRLMRYLKTYLTKPISLINRSVEKAQTLTEEFGVQVFSLEELPSALAQADIVFSATGSAKPLINKNIIEKTFASRVKKPLMLIDIAVPRDIDPDVAMLPDVSLYCIDDLKMMIEKNLHGREHAAEKAREMIREKSRELMRELKSSDQVTHMIRAYRNKIEEICRVELIKAKQQLQLGIAPDAVLDAFAYAFTKKLLHSPSVQLRQAGVQGRSELLQFASQLLAIPEVERL